MPRILKAAKTTAAKKKPIGAKKTSTTPVRAAAKNQTQVHAASRKKPGGRKNPSASLGGSYVTPSGNVSLRVPPFWTLRQTNDDLEVESPSGATSVIVTAFQRDETTVKLDAREYLEKFLRTAPIKGRAHTESNGRSRAVSRFRDLEGDHWEVEFLSDGDTLLLATMNSTQSLRSEELRTGAGVLRSLKLNGK